MNFTQQIFRNCNLDSNALIYNNNKITYRYLRELTGQYYNFLKHKNIKAAKCHGFEEIISTMDENWKDRAKDRDTWAAEEEQWVQQAMQNKMIV